MSSPTDTFSNIPWFTFATAITYREFGTLRYTVLYLNQAIQDQLTFAKNGRLRVEGDINGLSFEGAWQPQKDGRKYLILNQKFLKAIESKVGDIVECTFTIADQDAVNEPDGLRDYLKEIGLYEKWLILTPGQRRGLCHQYFAAKTEPTKQKRLKWIAELITESNKTV